MGNFGLEARSFRSVGKMRPTVLLSGAKMYLPCSTVAFLTAIRGAFGAFEMAVVATALWPVWPKNSIPETGASGFFFLCKYREVTKTSK